MSSLESDVPGLGLSAQDATTATGSAAATWVLAGVAGLSFLIYLFGWVYPYNIFDLYPRPRLAVFRFAQDDPLVIWWLAFTFVIQSGLYWVGWRAAHHARGRAAWLIVLGGALASGTALLFIYPFDATDIFDYIMHGRIMGVYGGNPFQDVAAQFPTDPFLPYASWQTSPSFYGPLWELIAGATAWLSGDGLIATVFAFKLVAGLFLGASVALVALILRQAAPERTLAGVTLLAWNPVLLYVTLGNGHNDITLTFSILAGLWALLQRRYTLAVLALVLGGLFKFVPFALLPAAGLIALRNLPDNPTRARFLGVTALAALGLMTLAYAPFWLGPATLVGLNRQSTLFTASLPAFFYTWLWPTIGKEQAALFVIRVTNTLTILFVVWQSWRAWREPTWLRFSQVTLYILLFYLLVTCSWFQQWYTIWPLGVAAVLPPGPAVYLTLILGGYAVLSKQIIFGPLIFRLHPFPGTWREIWFAPTVLGLPWLYALFALAESLLHKLIRLEVQDKIDRA